MHLERRCGLANGRCGRFRAAHQAWPILPEQAQSEKSQGVRGTESPDSFNNTLKKTENYVSVFSGELHNKCGKKAYKEEKMLRKIDCIMIRVENIEAAASYYAEVFGLRPRWRGRLDWSRISRDRC